MPDAVGLLKIIKKAAVEAVDASKPCGVYFGKVVSVSPLKISVEQKLTLGREQLILCRGVVDYETEITMQSGTKKKALIHNALKTGERVAMVRVQGGQKFLVLDRVGDA